MVVFSLFTIPLQWLLVYDAGFVTRFLTTAAESYRVFITSPYNGDGAIESKKHAYFIPKPS